jgi:hypothetical protein
MPRACGKRFPDCVALPPAFARRRDTPALRGHRPPSERCAARDATGGAGPHTCASRAFRDPGLSESLLGATARDTSAEFEHGHSLGVREFVCK